MLPRLAPFRVPWQRRLQTFAVLVWTLTQPFFGVPFCIFVTAWMIFLPIFWPIIIPYLIFIFFYDQRSSKGGAPVRWIQNLQFWQHARDFFPVTLVRTSPLSSDKHYIFCFHPHGVISTGVSTNFLSNGRIFSDLFPGIDLRVLTLRVLFFIPFYREYLMAYGLCDVSRESVLYNLSRGPGSSVLIVVGGATEALDAHPGLNRLTLSNRKGFVKIALETGSSLVPIYSFGENNVYTQVVNNPRGSRMRKFQIWVQRNLGFSTPLFHGRGIFNYDFGVIPFRRPITSVVGGPLHLPKIENPSQQQIDQWHAKYVEALQKLYDSYKEIFDKDRKSELEIL